MHESKLFNLAGKVSLVTGAGSGLGRALCEAVAEHGSDVVCPDKSEARAQETANMIAKYGVKALTPQRRFGKPEELEGLAVLLASGDASSFITGAAILTDGGWCAW